MPAGLCHVKCGRQYRSGSPQVLAFVIDVCLQTLCIRSTIPERASFGEQHGLSAICAEEACFSFYARIHCRGKTDGQAQE